MSEKSRSRPALALAILAATLVFPRVADAAIDGRWILEFEPKEDRVQLTTKRSSWHGHSENSCSYPTSAFRGLTRPKSSTDSPARFEMVRDAGTLTFEGQLDSGGGSGRFSFQADSAFAADMAKLGHDHLSDENLYTMAIHDIDRAFVRGLADAGYPRLSFDDLVAMRIHGATPQFVRDLASLG